MPAVRFPSPSNVYRIALGVSSLSARALLAGCLSVAAALPVPARGADAPAAARVIRIPAQSLHEALQQYSRQTGRSVLYDAEQVAGRRSAPVAGIRDADQALRVLMAGTGMAARFVSREAFMIVPQPPSAPAGGEPVPGSPEQVARSRRFLRDLQGRVQRALCADPAIEAGGYRMALHVRVNAAGRLHDVKASATGRPELEPRIVGRLAGLPLPSHAPAGVRQPILLLVREGAAGCAS